MNRLPEGWREGGEINVLYKKKFFLFRNFFRTLTSTLELGPVEVNEGKINQHFSHLALRSFTFLYSLLSPLSVADEPLFAGCTI